MPEYTAPPDGAYVFEDSWSCCRCYTIQRLHPFTYFRYCISCETKMCAECMYPAAV